MGLNWNEIKSRALLFSKTWADGCNEKSQSIPFWIDFFDIFGIPNKRVATFEHNVKKLSGAPGFVDLFWPGKLLVEQKSLGKDLAGTQKHNGRHPGDKPQLGHATIRSRQCVAPCLTSHTELRQAY